MILFILQIVKQESKSPENYRIQVHALKSGSRTIGANELSDEALHLEEAAKSGDTDYIRSNTQRVLEQYRALTERIRSVLESGGGSEQECGSTVTERRVLYIEADLMFRCLTERMLREYGVMSVGSGREALKLLEERLPELILLSPSGADAVSLLKSLKSNERLKDVPVVIYTADHSADAEVMFLRAGADDVIRKPADCGVLTERVNKILLMEANTASA